MKKTILSTILLVSSFLFFLFAYNQHKISKTTPNQTLTTPASIIQPKLQQNVYNPQALTLNKIFNSDHSWTATISANQRIELLATGDVIPARSVNFQSAQHNDFTWAWSNLANFLKNSDLTIINLESPLIKNCPVTNEGMIFCGSSEHIKGLKLADIDIVNIANNHYGNHGQDGIEQSNQILTDHNISITGGTNILYKKVKDKTIAFLGYNEIEHLSESLGQINETQIKNDIQQAKTKSNIIIVSYHWGAEYQAQPENYRINLAHKTIDWGADLIIGNHPHWIQPVEIYKNKIITYAHGNFIFDQEWSTETKQGIVSQYTFYNNQIIDVQFTPVFIKDYGQVDFADPTMAKNILKNMHYQSQILQQKIESPESSNSSL